MLTKIPRLQVSLCWCLLSILTQSVSVTGAQLKPIPERVAEKGDIRIVAGGEKTPIPFLRSLLARSDMIIRARVASQTSSLSENQRGIFTDFLFDISAVVHSKRPTEPLGQITLRLFGGKIVFPEGTAEAINLNFRHFPSTGEEYIVFLQLKNSAEAPEYQLTENSSESLFQILEGRLMPTTDQGMPLFDQMLGVPVEQFLEDLTKY